MKKSDLFQVQKELEDLKARLSALEHGVPVTVTATNFPEKCLQSGTKNGTGRLDK